MRRGSEGLNPSIAEQRKHVKALLRLHGEVEREVYLDLENSGLIFPEALDAMSETYRSCGHPSITHKLGWRGYDVILEAEENLRKLINVDGGDIVFTHSGTEANNLAIIGLAKAKPSRKKIVYSAIEHLSVKFPAESLQELGFKVEEIPVNEEGFVNLDKLSDLIDKDTLLVSIAAVNHEIGTIQDLKAVIEIVKDKDPEIIVHTDACDALGRIRLDFSKLEVDMASFSSHKVYGPRGAGALYKREGIELKPILHGQLSSQTLWPGVENVPALAGFAKALEILERNFDAYREKMRKLRDMLIEGATSSLDGVFLNGPRGDKRAPDNVNLSFLRCEGEALTVELSLRGVYASSGSACTSRILEPSHVLISIGRPYEIAHGSILMKTSPMHDEEDIRYAVEQIIEAVNRIRSLAPREVK